MNEEDIKWRKCQVAGCGYKELRGSRQGDFIAGEFVCPEHYAHLSRPSEVIVREMRDEWPERS